jgi:hypothetical protein
MTRGRTNKPAGESHYRAVLTEDIVRAMRADYRPYAFSVAKCAKKHNVPFKAARAAITRETWAHVK